MSGVISCRVCDAVSAAEPHVITEMMFGTRDQFAYVTCGNCGTMQIASIPDDLGKYYPAESYYSFNSFWQPSRLKRAVKVLLAGWMVGSPGRFPRRWTGFDRLKQATQPWIALPPGLTKRSRILDVGCGEGGKLRSLAAMGFQNLAGVDPFLAPERAGVVDGVQLIRAELDDVVGHFDLVTMHHSLEHVPDPVAVLASARNRLNPGGQILVRIPVLQPEIWDRFGKHWCQIDAPRHLYLFTAKALIDLCARLELELVSVTYDSEGWALAWSEAYRQGVSMYGTDGQPRSLPFTAEQLAAFGQEAERMNAAQCGDQACFVFRKAN